MRMDTRLKRYVRRNSRSSVIKVSVEWPKRNTK